MESYLPMRHDRTVLPVIAVTAMESARYLT